MSRTEIIARAKKEARFIIANHASVREAELHFYVGKSTIHKDVTERLLDYSPDLVADVCAVFADHKRGIGHRSLTIS